MNYKDASLKECERAGTLFDVICEGDKKKINVEYNESTERFLTSIRNFVSNVIDVVKPIVDIVSSKYFLKILKQKKWYKKKKGKRYVYYKRKM